MAPARSNSRAQNPPYLGLPSLRALLWPFPTSLILVAVGTGVGFASISPWAQHGVSATTFTVAGVIWLIVTQWLSACAGGYIAGRLRTRWHGTHTHEVFFRDTAHGLITWSVATMLIASIFGSALFSAAGAGARAASDVVCGRRQRRVDESNVT